MVKSGSFKVSPGSTLGRIGSGVGKGLSEQLPKEIERYRLKEGLQQFEQDSANLTPLQQYTRLLSIPGISPQAIQAMPEILKQQNLRQSFMNKRGGVQGASSEIPQEGSLQPEERFQSGSIGAQGNEPSQMLRQEIVRPEEIGQPQIVETNPLRQEAVPRKSWSPERFEQEIGRVWEDRPNMTLQEAVALAQQNEQRYLNEPESVRRQDDYFREQQNKLDDVFNKKLETKLQKEGTDVFKDITGESRNNLMRSMYKDLRTNPDATIEDIANKWSEKALDLAKTKSDLDTLANRDFVDKLFKGNKTREQLESYQKIFKETGDSEEYYKTLISKFGMSPQGAASIAFPPSKSVRSYMDKVKSSEKDIAKAPVRARKYANDIESFIQRDDSILAIARDLRQKDPFFDERAFFSELRQNMDSMSLSPRQRREIAKGESDLFKTWGDILIQPWGSK